MIINGKTAIVTGGASGMGEATVIRLHQAGARVVIADLNEEKGNKLALQLGINAICIKTDVSSVDEVQYLCKAAVEAFGAVHILVNNAGLGTIGRTLGKSGPLNLKVFKKTIEVNLVGAFNMLSNAAWEMDKNEREDGEKGVIINVSSIAAYDGQIGQASYSASKAGIIGMTLPIARDLARHGIRVCTIAPGIIDTPMLKEVPEPARQSLAKQVPFPARLGDPDEFARLVQHIIENGYLNAECIRLDGGIRMGPQ
ncbi:3-hydroxyacyl-coa dehydrogenase [hydrocarbon metagenome]|uniref:3-hydroxyacyl-coa dehydrogenase n=1 Tax=hydrocarbon metagenome TaxID=938273 RepID=A0A0W8E2B2_9ZZZZ